MTAQMAIKMPDIFKNNHCYLLCLDQVVYDRWLQIRIHILIISATSATSATNLPQISLLLEVFLL